MLVLLGVVVAPPSWHCSLMGKQAVSFSSQQANADAPMLHVALLEQTKGDAALRNLAESPDIKLKASKNTGVTIEEAACWASW